MKVIKRKKNNDNKLKAKNYEDDIFILHQAASKRL